MSSQFPVQLSQINSFRINPSTHTTQSHTTQLKINLSPHHKSEHELYYFLSATKILIDV